MNDNLNNALTKAKDTLAGFDGSAGERRQPTPVALLLALSRLVTEVELDADRRAADIERAPTERR